MPSLTLSKNLPVQSQQPKHYKKVLNKFKVNNLNKFHTSLKCFIDFEQVNVVYGPPLAERNSRNSIEIMKNVLKLKF